VDLAPLVDKYVGEIEKRPGRSQIRDELIETSVSDVAPANSPRPGVDDEFFRSLVAVLGDRPPRGSFVGKANRRNCRLGAADTEPSTHAPALTSRTRRARTTSSRAAGSTRRGRGGRSLPFLEELGCAVLIP
jgi:hypothetical protein